VSLYSCPFRYFIPSLPTIISFVSVSVVGLSFGLARKTRYGTRFRSNGFFVLHHHHEHEHGRTIKLLGGSEGHIQKNMIEHRGRR
jgi:hypothetical protein